MPTVLEQLREQLALEPIEENLFRGQSQDLGWGTVFGGQVLGQALSAAEQTVDADRTCHSLHAYFLRPGDVTRPIVYEVDRIRDGRSFTTRRVVAIQKGRAIFNMSASFQIAEEGLEHAVEAPPAPPPESLLSQEQLAAAVADRLPPGIREQATMTRPIEIRPVNPGNPLKPTVAPPTKQVWMKAIGPLPDDPREHRHLLAYASDFHLLPTALQPHGVSWLDPSLKLASIDHTMWFHRPFRLDEWLLYDMESTTTSGARGLVRGRIFTREGRLVASTMQEGLMRK